MNEQNLRPRQLSTEEASRIGKKGGKRSVQARKEKKLLSQVLGELMVEKFDVPIDDSLTEMFGSDLVKLVAIKVLARADSASVALIRVILEATEGTKSQVEQELKITLDFDTEGL